MGRYRDGLLGIINGKVGPIIGSSWRGINYLRSKGPSRRNNNSDKQLRQQAKFRVAVQFTRNMNELFKITFKSKANEKTPRNHALALTVSEAVTGTYPDFTLDYSKVKISNGSLPKPLAATLTIMAGTAHWQWSFNSRLHRLSAAHRAVMVVYCPALENSLYEVFGPEKSETAASLDITPLMGQTVQTWLAFISEDSNQISDSVYTGQVVVA